MKKKERRKCRMLDRKFGLAEGTTQSLRDNAFPRFFRHIEKEKIKCQTNIKN